MGVTKKKQQEAKSDTDQKFAMAQPNRQILEDLAVCQLLPSTVSARMSTKHLLNRANDLSIHLSNVSHRLPAQRIHLLIIPSNMHFAFPSHQRDPSCVMPFRFWMDLSRKDTNIKWIVCMGLHAPFIY